MKDMALNWKCFILKLMWFSTQKTIFTWMPIKVFWTSIVKWLTLSLWVRPVDRALEPGQVNPNTINVICVASPSLCRWAGTRHIKQSVLAQCKADIINISLNVSCSGSWYSYNIEHLALNKITRSLSHSDKENLHNMYMHYDKMNPLLPTTLHYLAFFPFEQWLTNLTLFQKQDRRTQLDIYVFVTMPSFVVEY